MSLIKFPLDDLAGEGIVRETEFREKLNKLDYEPYRNQAVLIPWVHHTELPIWCYLMAVARLTTVAAVLSFGEACSPITLLQRARPGSEPPAETPHIT
ncbi:DUF2480 family protein [candidate division KSB1 bacterium]|nr:DUF2480 family protein [candidate division KSB1 bacterium]